jgi:NAD(P)-dependent dehydrogenase (short-subunit alcohol dehydrogenase family)
MDGVAVITGASRGIGAAIAQRFAAAGLKVAITARTAEEGDHRLEGSLATTASRIRAEGGTVLTITADLAKQADRAGIVETVERELGPIDILVNNAAVNHLGPVAELSTDDWDRTIGVDLSGPWYLIRAVVPDMITRGRGSIVNITSVAGFTAPLREGPYSASKAALHSLTRTVATELGPQGIRCNSVAPGLVWTRFMEKYEEQFRPELERTPLGRFGQPEDVADVVAFLVSDESRFITGEVLNVSGGWYLRP